MSKIKRTKEIILGLILLLIFSISPQLIHAADNEQDLSKQEMRAAWISTVVNIDLKPGMNEEQYREWAESSISKLEDKNFNTVIFQVKPTSDALYPSELAPWSQYITGEKQGTDPGYDPLQIMLDTAHSHGMELHAWINPYRITMPSTSLDDLHEDNIANEHPEWVVHHGSQYYLDPGIPEVQDYLVSTAEELVTNYDVDAVHMDDYFYPGQDFEDEETYEEYGDDFDDIAAWRRNNVNELVGKLNQSIKDIKPWVQFGISPSGIYRNKSEDPTGSDTDGNGHYESLSVDSRHWIREELIDYITPQIYWTREFEIAKYSVLQEWWSNETKGYNVNLYIGMADYKVNDNFDTAWDNPREITEQILENRQNDEIKGQMHFTLGDIFENRIGYSDIVDEEVYNYKSLTPEFAWLNADVPHKPSAVEISREANGNKIEINHEDARKFVIYREELGKEIDYDNPENIVGVVYNKNDEVTFFDKDIDSTNLYTYGVTSLSNTGIESTEATEINEGSIEQMQKHIDLLLEKGELEDKETANRISRHLEAVDHYIQSDKTDKAVKHMENLPKLVEALQSQGKVSDDASTIINQYTDFLLEEWK